MTKRFQTYFEAPIPPFKVEKLGAGSLTIRFILTGKIPSKKNNQMSVAVRRFARDWAKKHEKTGRNPSWADVNKAISLCKSKVRPNTEYKEWVEQMTKEEISDLTNISGKQYFSKIKYEY